MLTHPLVFALVLCLLGALGAGAAAAAEPAPARPRALVMDALSPLTRRSQARRVRSQLRHAGFTVVRVKPEALTRADWPARHRPDVLVLPSSEAYPAAAQAALEAYLKAGGRLLCVGGPPLTTWAYQTRRGWQTRQKALATLDSTPLPREATGVPEAWLRAASPAEGFTAARRVSSRHGHAARFDYARFSGWDTFALPRFAKSPYGAGRKVLTFWAKGDRGTDALVVEWREADNSRWMVSVPLTTEWRRVTILPGDFRYWPDSSTRGRGGPQDRFNPQKAAQLSLGLAQSHAAMKPGPKSFQVAGLSTAALPPSMAEPERTVLEGAAPWYKLWADGRRPGRWGPIVRYRGVSGVMGPGRLTLGPESDDGPRHWVYRAHQGGLAGAAWAVARTSKDAPAAARELVRRWHVACAGPAVHAWRQGEQAELVARVAARPGAPGRHTVQAWWGPAAGGPRETASAVAAAGAGEGARVAAVPLAPSLAPGDYRYSVKVTDGAGGADTVRGRFTVLPAQQPSAQFVTVEGGELVLAGKPWRPVGVNYWPLWVSGQDSDAYMLGWPRPEQYDPDLIEADLASLKRLGANMVSVQYTQLEMAPALNDLLARCRNHGIRAHVFVDGGHPLYGDPSRLVQLIRAADLAGNDAVFAYDVAWEPSVGNHERRRRFDREWAAWVNEQYGSLEKAERDWGVAAPREDGEVANPADDQLTQDGPWRRMVAAYRRFMDDRISQGYSRVRDTILSVDPNHLVCARTGYGGNGSLYVEGVMAFDLRAGAAHLDFVSPEGYSLTDDWRDVRGGGGYITAYSRWAGGGKPVVWVEFGRSVYPQTTGAKIKQQGEFHTLVYRMIEESRSNGTASWWWPGGYRVNENSDFGIVGRDGTPRPAALAMKKWSPRIQGMPLSPSGRHVMQTHDRDADARGFAGVWMAGKPEFLAALERGEAPVLTTEATGTDTGSMPLTAVGNVPADGANPLKHANGELTLMPGGKLRAVNTGEAAWRAQGAGRVVVRALAGGRVVAEAPLPDDVPRFGRVEVALPAAARTGGRVTLRLAVVGRDPGPLGFGQGLVLE